MQSDGKTGPAPDHQVADDLIDEALEESFPASDPPATGDFQRHDPREPVAPRPGTPPTGVTPG